MSENERVGRVVMSTNMDDNGGEAVTFIAEVFDNGDDSDNIHVIVEVGLESYGRSATINLGQVKPDFFRVFAEHVQMEVDSHSKIEK